jgi:hypothetical protein
MVLVTGDIQVRLLNRISGLARRPRRGDTHPDSIGQSPQTTGRSDRP